MPCADRQYAAAMAACYLTFAQRHGASQRLLDSCMRATSRRRAAWPRPEAYPRTGGACVRHDLRRAGWCQGQRTDSRALAILPAIVVAATLLSSFGPPSHKPAWKTGSMRVVGNPRYEICRGHPVHSFCLQLARTNGDSLLNEHAGTIMFAWCGAVELGPIKLPAQLSGMPYILSADAQRIATA